MVMDGRYKGTHDEQKARDVQPVNDDDGGSQDDGGGSGDGGGGGEDDGGDDDQPEVDVFPVGSIFWDKSGHRHTHTDTH